MAKDKSSFILYADLLSTVSKLSDKKAGMLFKIILQYVNDLNPEVTDNLLQIAFEPVKQQLKRDLKKWDRYIEKQSENGKLGGRPKVQNQTEYEASDGEHFTYLIYDKVNNEYKIGETQNLAKRKLTIKRPTADLSVIHFIKNTPEVCQQLERDIRSKFRLNIISGDWLSLNKQELSDIISLMDSQKSQAFSKIAKKADSDNVTVNVNDTVSEREITGEVFYNVEELVLKNKIWFDEILMAVGLTKQQGKESLRKFHLYLEEKSDYPKQKKPLISGFEKWLRNEKKFINGNPTHHKSNQQSAVRKDEGATELTGKLKDKLASGLSPG